MIYAVLLFILVAALVLMFNKGAAGPDTMQKRDQDWAALQAHTKKR